MQTEFNQSNLYIWQYQYHQQIILNDYQFGNSKVELQERENNINPIEHEEWTTFWGSGQNSILYDEV
jgi:hypothetical protein